MNENAAAPEQYMYQHPSGSVECKVCLSAHASVTSYLTHARGKRHIQNVSKYSVSAKDGASRESTRPQAVAKKKFKKIGIPKYDIVKIRDSATKQLGLRVELQLPRIKHDVIPQFRLMSAYEQTVEEIDTKYQYLVIAAEPYDSVALRIPMLPVDEEKTVVHFDKDSSVYYVQLLFDQ